jgi:hypothetical protein
VIDIPKGNHSGFGELSVLPIWAFIKLRNRLGLPLLQQLAVNPIRWEPHWKIPAQPGLPRANAVENQSVTGIQMAFPWAVWSGWNWRGFLFSFNGNYQIGRWSVQMDLNPHWTCLLRKCFVFLVLALLGLDITTQVVSLCGGIVSTLTP